MNMKTIYLTMAMSAVAIMLATPTTMAIQEREYCTPGVSIDEPLWVVVPEQCTYGPDAGYYLVALQEDACDLGLSSETC